MLRNGFIVKLVLTKTDGGSFVKLIQVFTLPVHVNRHRGFLEDVWLREVSYLLMVWLGEVSCLIMVWFGVVSCLIMVWFESMDLETVKNASH